MLTVASTLTACLLLVEWWTLPTQRGTVSVGTHKALNLAEAVTSPQPRFDQLSVHVIPAVLTDCGENGDIYAGGLRQLHRVILRVSWLMVCTPELRLRFGRTEVAMSLEKGNI